MNQLAPITSSHAHAIIVASGVRAPYRFLEFFTANIRNPHTRRAYARAATEFFDWLAAKGVTQLADIASVHVATYIEELCRARSAPTAKLRLAALKHLFDWMVTGQIMPTNPAAAVRGPRHIVRRGKTPVLDPAEARQLLDAIDTTTVIGLRDRALIGLMVYSFARKGTQRLRKALAAKEWVKTTFVVEKRINGIPRESQSHEVDHVRTFDSGARIALEIEWNNKDPFYDRDLENYKRLHADGAISVGVIVTRGKSLHENMRNLVRRFIDDHQLSKLDDLREWGYDPTSKQRAAITKQMNRKKDPLTFREAFTNKFVADKFGEATTHWRKLEDRVRRGVGNPCPLVLIGLPDSIVTFHEGKRALAEVEAAEAADDPDDGSAP